MTVRDPQTGKLAAPGKASGGGIGDGDYLESTWKGTISAKVLAGTSLPAADDANPNPP